MVLLWDQLPRHRSRTYPVKVVRDSLKANVIFWYPEYMNFAYLDGSFTLAGGISFGVYLLFQLFEQILIIVRDFQGA